MYTGGIEFKEEKQWNVVKDDTPVIPTTSSGALLSLYCPRRQIINKMTCVGLWTPSFMSRPQDANGGCSPMNILPGQVSITIFAKWSKDGILEAINTALCKMDRLKRGRKATPSAALIDSQSVKTTRESQDAGFDGGKKVKGHKRHILVDTVGNMLNVVVSAANLSDIAGGKLLIHRILDDFSNIEKIWADGTYRGGLIDWVRDTLDATLEIVKRDDGQKGFKVLPRRWVVERTLSWLGNYRRLSKDYERLTRNSEGMIYLASIQTMLKRVAA